MKTSEILYSFAKYLENPDNEILTQSEKNSSEDCATAAFACIEAAKILKQAAEELSESEPDITEESLSELSDIADAFDASGDPELEASASAIDSLIRSFVKKAEYTREDAFTIEDLKKLYNQQNRVDAKKADLKKKYEQSEYTKAYKPLEAPLMTRHCPDHPGVNMIRLGDQVGQCQMDKKVYDFRSGFTTLNNNKVPGTSITNQRSMDRQVFDASSGSTRDDRVR